MAYRGDPDRWRSPDAHHLHDPPLVTVRTRCHSPNSAGVGRPHRAQVLAEVLPVILILLQVASAVIIVLAIATH